MAALAAPSSNSSCCRGDRYYTATRLLYIIQSPLAAGDYPVHDHVSRGSAIPCSHPMKRSKDHH